MSLRLEKVKEPSGAVHVIDREANPAERDYSGTVAPRYLCGVQMLLAPDDRFVDRLAIGCPECRSAATRWILGGPL